MAVVAYQLARVGTWLIWVAWLAYNVHFLRDRAPHFDPLGQLRLSTEMVMFGLPLAGMAAGLLLLYLRDLAYGPIADAQKR